MTQPMPPLPRGRDLDAVEPADLNVHGMPTSAFGPRGASNAATLLDLGALAAGRGLTRSQVNAFLGKAQNAALKAILEAAADLLDTSGQLTQAKLNEVATRIERLPRVTPQATGWRALLTASDPNGVAYVSLDQVRMILTEAMASSVPTIN